MGTVQGWGIPHGIGPSQCPLWSIHAIIIRGGGRRSREGIEEDGSLVLGLWQDLSA